MSEEETPDTTSSKAAREQFRARVRDSLQTHELPGQPGHDRLTPDPSGIAADMFAFPERLRKDPAARLEFFRKAGILDERGSLTEPYRDRDAMDTTDTADAVSTTETTVRPAASPIPVGWRITRTDRKPFRRIEVRAPNGYAAEVDSTARNPENILYMLADALLCAQAGTGDAGQVDHVDHVGHASDAAAEWRKLALQYDRQRMQALWHLRALIENPVAHVDAARSFLSAPPAFDQTSELEK
jgi:hypothetical protein